MALQFTTIYLPDAGFTEIASGPLDLLMDVEACEAAHADRIVAVLAEYVDTDWQRREYVTPSLDTPPLPPSAAPAGGAMPPARPTTCAEVA